MTISRGAESAVAVEDKVQDKDNMLHVEGRKAYRGQQKCFYIQA